VIAPLRAPAAKVSPRPVLYAAHPSAATVRNPDPERMATIRSFRWPNTYKLKELSTL